jgi:hypothetical protein
MRRALFSAQPGRILSRAMATSAPRPVVPIIASSPSEQIHPVGAFYEAVMSYKLGTPPTPKLESSQPTPKKAEPAPEPKESKPPAEKAAEPAPAAAEPAAEPAAEDKKRNGRGRKAKASVTADIKKEEPASAKAKSV